MGLRSLLVLTSLVLGIVLIRATFDAAGKINFKIQVFKKCVNGDAM